MSDDNERFESRIAALRQRGFDVEAPTGELASEQMLRLEEQADRAAIIRSKVLDLPEHRSDERRRFLSQLANPMEAGAVEIELSGLLRRHRPWVILAERSRVKWSDEGRSVELSNLLERLDAVDDAIVLGSPRILSMIEEASPSREVEPILVEIERRQERRFNALQGMVEMLSERGWDVSGIQTGQMHEQFTEAERLHSLDGVLTQCQRQIENDIRPFGHDIAERLWGGVMLAQKEATQEALTRIKSEIDTAADDLFKRHAHVEARIAEWQRDGFDLPVKLPLLAGEMITWEAKLPRFSEQIEATHGIWSQMETHLAQWPEYRRLAERTRGHLDAVQALDVLLQGLTAKTEGARTACISRLESWAAHGIETSTWAPLIDSEPRAVLEELDAHQPFIDVLVPLIENLLTLDTSIDGASEVEVWLQQLRSENAGMEVVEDAKDWHDIATSRRLRHRNFLDLARMDLATLWPTELDSENLDLATYEAAISGIESSGELPSTINVKVDTSEDNERLNHVIRGLKSELDDWRHLGWAIEGVREMLESDPVQLGLDLPEIRHSMSVHDARIARLLPLPWALDVELAERVLSDLMRPEKLSALDEELQDLMLTLANAEGEGDPNFDFKPFKPQSPMARIEAKRPVLIPVIDDVVEDEGGGPDAELVSGDSLPVEKPTFLTGIASTGKAETIRRTVEQAMEKSTKDEKEEIDIQDDVHQGVRDLLGLGSKDQSLNLLLSPPLDVRVQRLGRIAILLEQGDSSTHRALQSRLPPIAKKLETWTAERLSRRHSGSGNGLLNDAKTLGKKLADIPGPGFTMPLEMDKFPLPEINDLEGISVAIKRLEGSVMLPSAMMQPPEAVES